MDIGAAITPLDLRQSSAQDILDLHDLALQHIDNDHKRTELHLIRSSEAELSKEDIGAAISLLGMRQPFAPVVSTPIGLDEQQIIDNDYKHTELPQISPCQADSEKKDVGAAISLLGLRQPFAPVMSTPIGLFTSDMHDRQMNVNLDTPKILMKNERRCVRRNILHELLELEDESF